MNRKRNYHVPLDVNNKKVRKEDSSPNPFANFPTYPKLQDSIDYGKEYEQLMCGLYALKFSTDDDVLDFTMTSNNKEYGVFDDIELSATFKDNKRQIYLLQLKHKESEKPITGSALTTTDKRGAFCLGKYLDSLSKIKIEDVACILYTNTGTNIRPNMCLTDNFSYNILIEDCQRQLDYGHLIFNTKEDANLPAVFQFRLEGTGSKKFYFFTQQLNIHAIKPKIESLLRRFTQVDIYEPFVHFMKEWWSRNFVLNKHDFVTKLVELACLPFIRAISGEKGNEKSEQITQTIKDFDLTFVEDDKEAIVQKIWPIAEEEFDFSVAMQKFGLTAREPSPIQKSIILWHLGLVPLIIKYEESNKIQIRCIMQLLARSWGTKSVIIVGDVERSEFNTWKIFGNLSDLKTLQEKFNDISQNFRISLQGRKYISLAEVPHIASITGTRELLKMSQEESLVVDRPNHNFDQFYISRIMSSTFVKTKFVLSSYEYAKDCLIVIKCEENHIKNLPVSIRFNTITLPKFLEGDHPEETDNPLVLCTENMSISDFERVCKKSKKPEIYVLEVHDDDHCRVLLKKGNKFLSRKILHTERFIEENKIFSSFNHSLNVICAPPGMGKSLFLHKISTQCPSNLWSVHVILINQKMFLKTRPTNEEMLHHFLGVDNNGDDFASKLKKCWPMDKFQFFLDGLDEVEYRSIVLLLNFAKFLSSKNATVWISTRENLRDFVSNYLYVAPIEILKFTQEDQKQYIHERLKTKFDIGAREKIIKTVFESAGATNSQQLLGIPLQLYIITEMLLSNDEAYDQLNDQNTFVLTKMYKLFFDRKKNFFFEKLGVDEYELGFNFDHHLKLYQIPALQTCLEESDFTLLNLNTKKVKSFLDQVRTNGDKYGIIREVFDEDQTVFVHQTYAEYFACLWLNRHPEKVILLRDAIFSEKYRNLRLIFDIMVAEDNPLHLAVIYKNVDQIGKHLNCFSEKDEYGRTALHLLFSNGINYYISRLGRLGRESEIYIAIVQTMVDKSWSTLVLAIDTLFSFNCINYSLASHCLYSLEAILEKEIIRYEDLEKNLGDDVDMKMVAYYCSQLGYPHLLSSIIRKKPEVVNEKFDEASLLHAAALGSIDDTYLLPRQGNIEVIKILVDRGCPLDGNILDFACRNGCYDVLTILSQLGATCSDGNTVLHRITEYDIIDERVINLIQTLNIDINAKNDDGLTPLHIACKNQKFENVNQLLHLGVDVNLIDERNKTALHHAVLPSKEITEIVDLLMERNIEIDACDDSGTTALHTACSWGKFDTVKKLLEQGADPDVLDNYKKNALYYAIESFQNKSEIIDLLFEYRVDVNARTQDRSTILHYACNRRNVSIVRKLLTLGVDVSAVDDYDMNALHHAVETNQDNTEIIELLIKEGISVDSQDEDGRTPLHIACKQEQLDNVKKLLKYAANINSVDNDNATTLHYAAQGHNDNTDILGELLRFGFDVNAKDKQGRTPLHFACQSAILSNVQKLLDNGADVNIVDLEQRNVLHYAAQSTDNNGNLVELLTTVYKFDVNAKNAKGQTALHLCLECGPVDNSEEILQRGADVNAVDGDGMNALHYAAKSNMKDEEVMTLIIDKKLDVNSRTKNGRSPLHLACLEYHTEAVKILINSGADVNAVDDDGTNALHYASQSDKENKEIINILIHKGLNVNAIDCKGRTPLHFAGYSQVIHNFQLLLRRNADVNAVDNDNMTVLHYAALSSYENIKIINYLVSNIGFDINVCNRNQETPLHLACQAGNVMNIEALLKYGPDVNKLTSSGKDIRHYATMSRNREVVLEEVLSDLEFLHL